MDEYREESHIQHFHSRTGQQKSNPWRGNGIHASWMQSGEQNFVAENDTASKQFTYMGSVLPPGQSSQSRSRKVYFGLMSNQ